MAALDQRWTAAVYRVAAPSSSLTFNSGWQARLVVQYRHPQDRSVEPAITWRSFVSEMARAPSITTLAPPQNAASTSTCTSISLQIQKIFNKQTSLL